MVVEGRARLNGSAVAAGTVGCNDYKGRINMGLNMRDLTNDLAGHIGHDVVVVQYGNGSVCIECESCGEVLINSEDWQNEVRYGEHEDYDG